MAPLLTYVFAFMMVRLHFWCSSSSRQNQTEPDFIRKHIRTKLENALKNFSCFPFTRLLLARKREAEQDQKQAKSIFNAWLFHCLRLTWLESVERLDWSRDWFRLSWLERELLLYCKHITATCENSQRIVCRTTKSNSTLKIILVWHCSKLLTSEAFLCLIVKLHLEKNKLKQENNINSEGTREKVYMVICKISTRLTVGQLVWYARILFFSFKFFLVLW